MSSGDYSEILVTGSAGFVGQAVVRALRQRGHRVRGLDRLPTPGLDDAIVGEITDPAVVDRALADAKAVVHLAATPDDRPFMDQLLEPNVVGLYRVLDAARRQETSRLVLASSVRAVSGAMGEGKVVDTQTAAPRDHYALTKVWAEQAGALYARRGWIGSVIAARIGWLPRSPEGERDLHTSPHGHRVYLSRRDAGRFFIAAVEAEHRGFDVLYALGAGGAGRVDMDPSRDVIGYTPRDTWPSGALAEDRWREDEAGGG